VNRPRGSHGRPPGATEPLRVAVLVSYFPVPSQTFVMRQIAALIDVGCRVDVHPIRDPTGQEVPEEFRRHQLLQRTRYNRRPDEPRWRQLVRELGGATRVLARSPLGTLRDLRAPAGGVTITRRRLFRLAAELERHGPYDVLHCHFGPVGVWGMRARALIGSQAALSVVFHGYDLSRDTQAPDAYSDLFATAEALLPVSEHWRDRLLELGAPPDRVQVHHMGVDLAAWSYAERPVRDQLHLVSICRLVEKKGIADALAAVGELRDRGVPVRYTVVGDGPLLEELRAQRDRLELGEVVRFRGWAPPHEARAELYDADVLLAPSVTATDGDQEGIPVSIMEAMATGVPVVATWHSGIPELVRHGRDGFLAAERAPGELADHLERLASEPGSRQEMGRHARSTVAAAHDEERLTADLIRLFGDLRTSDERATGRSHT
jgi:colanic acid/amylovoran biosynthesis glycosyltransferase